MAARQKITPEMIQQMVELYETIGTYSGVAKAVGVSSSTAAKYIKEAQQVKTYDASLNSIPQPKDISEISRKEILTFSTLTEDEFKSYCAWMEEFA